MQPTPGFLPGESHGQSSMAGYIAFATWVCEESDTAEQIKHNTKTNLFIYC